MRGLVAVVLGVAMLAIVVLPIGAHPFAPNPQAAQSAGSPMWIQQLQSWLEAIVNHRPGDRDMPAILMGRASESDLVALREDYLALLKLHASAIKHPARGGDSISYKNQRFSVSGVQALLGLTNMEAERSDASRILKKAAILHADVAMLVVPVSRGLADCPTQSVIIINDGQEIGTSCTGIHWVHSRALLDAITPDPRKDATVRQWYQATIAHLLERRDYSSAVPQIEYGYQLFPKDPGLLFEHGYYHETFASRSVQPALRVTKTDMRPASTHLKEAEALFRRSLEANPEFVEARLHHGVVLGALGRHDDAASELRNVVASGMGPSALRYYAEMFLGNEEQALGRNDAARAHYNAAAALFPLARSPWAALSALARRGADRIEALAATRHMLSLPSGQEGRTEDPWWGYDSWLNQDAASRLRELYLPFMTGDQK